MFIVHKKIESLSKKRKTDVQDNIIKKQIICENTDGNILIYIIISQYIKYKINVIICLI